MKGVKGLSILGSVLLVAGIIGVLLTYSSEKETVSEVREIQDEDFNAIDINIDNAEVKVIATEDTTSKVELTGSKPKADKSKFIVDVVDGKLLIELKERQGKLLNFDFLTTSLTLNVYVPKKDYKSLKVISDNGKINMEHLNAKAIEATTSNGRLEMKDIKGSKVTAEVDNGRIQVENMQVDDMNLKSNNGTVELSQVDASYVKTETDNGKVLLEDVAGELVGKTSNGRISLVTDNLERPIEFETDNGIIKIETTKRPENVSFDVSVDNGKVDILGEFKSSTVIGNGDNHIKLTTSNGGIIVK